MDMPKCEALARELYEDRHRFEYLDPGQLLKHALGLATQLGESFSLHYLYYASPGKRGEAHRREVEYFAGMVGTEIRFNSLTYQQLYSRIRASKQAEPEYVDYLGGRYFSAPS